jgi:hypothetical protein
LVLVPHRDFLLLDEEGCENDNQALQDHGATQGLASEGVSVDLVELEEGSGVFGDRPPILTDNHHVGCKVAVAALLFRFMKSLVDCPDFYLLQHYSFKVDQEPILQLAFESVGMIKVDLAAAATFIF